MKSSSMSSRASCTVACRPSDPALGTARGNRPGGPSVPAIGALAHHGQVLEVKTLHGLAKGAGRIGGHAFAHGQAFPEAVCLVVGGTGKVFPQGLDVARVPPEQGV